MTIETLKGGCAGSELMARVALCGAVERFVSLGQRSRRNLSVRGRHSDAYRGEQQKQK